MLVYTYLASILTQKLILDATAILAGGWDIKVKDAGAEWQIQVKTVSAFSKTGRLSPIHTDWHRLYIIRLDKQLQPDGFWQIINPVVLPKYINAPLLNQPVSAAKQRLFSNNEIDDFLKCIEAGRKAAANFI